MSTDFHLERRPDPAEAPVLAAPPRVPVRPRAASGTWLLVVISDLTALAAATAGYSLWEGGSLEAFGTATTLAALAGLCLLVAGAWDRVETELGPLMRGFVAAVATVAVLSLAIESLVERTWAFGALPVACALAVAGRLGLRPVLRKQQTMAVTRVLAVGSEEAVAALVERVQQAPQHGWRVVAACTPTGTGPDGAPAIGNVPVAGDLDAVPRLARSGRFDTISVTPTGGWSPLRLRQLSAHLAGSRTELVVDPGLAAGAGSHTRLRSIDGLHLLRLTRPALPMSARLLKTVLDRTAALLLLVLTAPLLVVLAVAVRRDGGPALFREARVNARGCVVGLLRFRVTGPDGDTTRIGELMRRHGLDGLPQLLNVLTGSLALVGPRPLAVGDDQVPPLVTPGLTGLAGEGRVDRAELESRYAEQWSPTLDMRLLARALRSACRRVPR